MQTALPRRAVVDLENKLAPRSGRLASCTFTIGAEAANVRIITLTFKDDAGQALTENFCFTLLVLADDGGAALATGGSTGIAISTAGLIVDTPVAKKVFTILTESDGTCDLTWTDTGTEAVYLGVVMPDGYVEISAVIQNAA